MAIASVSSPILPVKTSSVHKSTPILPEGLTLIPISKLDLRSDGEIISQLKTYIPVTAEKNVWAYWNTGFDNMAPWVQRSVINWVRRLGSSWTVRVLDSVEGSPVHISKFVDDSHFPAAFNENRMTGPHVGPHSGDLVRLPLLYMYGGVWIDAGMFLFRDIDEICWDAIEDPESPYEIAGFIIEIRPNVQTMLNGFIAAKKDNAFIKRWHEIYVALWEGVTESKGFHKNPLLAHLPLLNPPVDKLNCPDLNLAMEDFSDYLAHFMCFERLRKLVDPADGFDGPAYFREKMFFLPTMKEMWYIQEVTGWSGTKQFDLLSAKRDSGNTEAELFANNLLANTSTMKLSHGPPGALASFLADIWDLEENKNKDIEVGTYAEFLRYGSVHFKQTRTLEPVRVEVTDEEVLIVGVL